MSGGPCNSPAVDPARLAAVRVRALDLLAVLDELELCQAAAYLSMVVDALDLAAEEGLPPEHVD